MSIVEGTSAFVEGISSRKSKECIGTFQKDTMAKSRDMTIAVRGLPVTTAVYKTGLQIVTCNLILLIFLVHTLSIIVCNI